MTDSSTANSRRFRRFFFCVLGEKFRRSFRTFLRPLVNLGLMVKYRCVIHPFARVDRNVSFGRGAMVGRAILDTMGGGGEIRIGANSIVYARCEIFAQGGSTVTLGECVLFTRHAAIVTGDHVFEDPTRPIMDQGIEVGDVTVGDDCWIGYNTLLVKGVTVGKGSIVGAGSVVVKDVDPMTVVGGIPARFIRRRG